MLCRNDCSLQRQGPIVHRSKIWFRSGCWKCHRKVILRWSHTVLLKLSPFLRTYCILSMDFMVYKVHENSSTLLQISLIFNCFCILKYAWSDIKFILFSWRQNCRSLDKYLVVYLHVLLLIMFYFTFYELIMSNRVFFDVQDSFNMRQPFWFSQRTRS